MPIFDKEKLKKMKEKEVPVKRHTIMIVDDEETLLTSLNTLFSEEYHIITSSDGQEALDLINKMENPESISLIISDQRMPKLTGIQFFEKIKGIIPNTIRIILTGFVDVPVILDAINKVKIYEFMLKPFEPDDLKLRVKRAVEAFDQHKELDQYRRNLEKMVEERTKELKNTQEQLIQAEKMASLGTLVAGVAHELNNPTSFIKMNSEAFSRVWEEIVPILDQHAQTNDDFEITDLPYKEAKKEIEKLICGFIDGSNRIGSIIEELKNFSTKEALNTNQTVDINKVLDASVKLTHNLIKKSTNHFSFESEHGLPALNGNFQRLEQVFINLIQNACQALPDKTCRILITTTFDKENKLIIVKVKDEGVGIEEKNIKYITDPFFTTKRSSGGIGLGLSISYKIIQEHGGNINFEATPGKGTTVFITLPVDPVKNEE